MNYTLKRGLFWLIVFTLLALIPLGLASAGRAPEPRAFMVELGVALGFLGLAPMAARRRAWRQPAAARLCSVYGTVRQSTAVVMPATVMVPRMSPRAFTATGTPNPRLVTPWRPTANPLIAIAHEHGVPSDP